MFSGLTDMMPAMPTMPSMSGMSFTGASEETKVQKEPDMPLHEGTMTCMCALSVTHDLKPARFPLPDDGLNHLAKCKWSCCGELWSCKECSCEEAILKARGPLSAEDALQLMAVEQRVEAAKEADVHARLNPPPVYPSDEGTPELITERKRRLALQAKTPAAAAPPKPPASEEVPSEAEEQDAPGNEDGGFFGFLNSLNPLPLMDSAGNYIASGTNATAGAIGDLLSIVNGQVILPVITPVFGFDRGELDEAMSSLTDSVDKPEAFAALLAKVAALYVAMLDLRDSDQRAIEKWLRDAVSAWVKVVGVKKPVLHVPLVPGEGRGDALLEIIAELPGDVSGEATRLNAHLSLAATLSPSRHMTETVFFDWYVMCRYNEVQFELPEFSGFPVITDAHTSAVSAVLRSEPAVYALLKDRRCKSGFSFDQATQWAIDTPGTPTGCVAGDGESFRMFSELYIAVILKLGVAANRTDTQGAGLRQDVWSHGGRYDTASAITGWQKLDQVYVRSLRLEGSRSVTGFSLPAIANRATRCAVEKLLTQALGQPPVVEALRGAIYSSHAPDAPKPPAGSQLEAVGGARDWPYGRGSVVCPAPPSGVQANYINCVVNEVDHLKVTVSCDCSVEVAVPLLLRDYAAVLDRIEDAMYSAHGHLYMRDATFGYLTSCPENCGTALQVTAAVRLPHLSLPKHDLSGTCRRLGLICSPAPPGSPPDAWVVSNLFTFGASEAEIMQGVVDGLLLLVAMEKTCANLQDPRSLLASLPLTYCLPSLALPEPGLLQPRQPKGDVVVSVTDDVPLFSERHTSVAADVLRRDPGAYHRLIVKTTAAGGWSVADSLRSAIDVHDCKVGTCMCLRL